MQTHSHWRSLLVRRKSDYFRIFYKFMLFNINYFDVVLVVLFYVGFQLFRKSQYWIWFFFQKIVWCKDISKMKTSIGQFITQILEVFLFLYGIDVLMWITDMDKVVSMIMLSFIIWVFWEIYQYFKTLKQFRPQFCYTLINWIWKTIALCIIGYYLF
jgi:hypothetical protein